MVRRVAIVAAGWLALVLYAWPGVMTMDSFDQLKEGRAWFFTDSHPPAMAALWGILDRIWAGPQLLLLLQTAMLAAGIYWIVGRRPLVTCAILLLPPIAAPMAVIWKDSLMAGFLALGVAALVHQRRWLALVAMGAATLMRYNAPAATLPLIVLLWQWRWTGWKRYAAATVAWIVTTGVAMGIGGALVAQEMHFWHSSLAVEDIVGTLAHVDEDLPDDELRPLLAPTKILLDHDFHATLRAKYDPSTFQSLVSGETRLWDLPLAGTVPAPAPQRDAIAHAWWAIVHGHVGAYLAYRMDVFVRAIGIGGRVTAPLVTHRGQYQGMLGYMGLPRTWYSGQEHVEKWFTWLARHTPLWSPWLWLMIALAALPLLWPHRTAFALALSGIGLVLSLYPLVQTPDYRYSHWLVITVALAAALYIEAGCAPSSSSLPTTSKKRSAGS